MRNILKIFTIILCISICSFGCSSRQSDEHSTEFSSTETSLPAEESSTVSETTISDTESESSTTIIETEMSTEDPGSYTDVISPNESGIYVHFIDVGQGDAVLLVCEGEAMMIDGGSSYDSDLAYAYLKKLEITHLKYMVATHPDDDHIGGLSGALRYASVERAFCSVDTYDSIPFENYRKALEKQGVSIEIPDTDEHLTLGSAEVKVLAPLENLEEINNNSIVIRVTYGNNSFLFTGDAEFSEESSILGSGQEIKSDVLKVGHHGSEYSTSSTFIDAVKPSIAVISCEKDNDYGFPKQRVLDLLAKNEIALYRTDLHGDIIVSSDGESISVSVEKETDNDPFTAPQEKIMDPSTIPDCDYVVNKSSRKFHKPDCEAVGKMKENNRWYYQGDRQALIEDGYEPCHMCNP